MPSHNIKCPQCRQTFIANRKVQVRNCPNCSKRIQVPYEDHDDISTGMLIAAIAISGSGGGDDSSSSFSGGGGDFGGAGVCQRG